MIYRHTKEQALDNLSELDQAFERQSFWSELEKWLEVSSGAIWASK